MSQDNEFFCPVDKITNSKHKERIDCIFSQPSVCVRTQAIQTNIHCPKENTRVLQILSQCITKMHNR